MDLKTLPNFKLQKKIDFAHFYTHIERNIILVEFQPYSTIDLENAKEIIDIVKSLSQKGKKSYGITKATSGNLVSTEARNYFSDNDFSRNHTAAMAVISVTLPMRLLFNFFIKFHKPPIPHKGFDNVESATNWLIDQGAPIK